MVESWLLGRSTFKRQSSVYPPRKMRGKVPGPVDLDWNTIWDMVIQGIEDFYDREEEYLIPADMGYKQHSANVITPSLKMKDYFKELFEMIIEDELGE
jgi:hypothetical protein